MRARNMFKKIAIIGVGLIGGSIGLAVKKHKLAIEVIGIGRRKISIKKALDRRAIDKGSLSIKEGLGGADLIIIATPVNRVIPKLKEAIASAKEGAILIDVNSTKNNIVTYADKAIKGKNVLFVGTHPMAGSDQAGVTYADKDLFENSVCIMTSTKNTNSRAFNKIKRFWSRLGARIVLMSPTQHDQAVSNISHLPHIISYALSHAVPTEDLRIAGTGFKDTTRIAKSNPDMWSDIFMDNKNSLLKSISAFKKTLSELESDIKKNKRSQLTKKLASAKTKRDSLG